MEPGELFANRFLIEDLLGEGGIGRVYRAKELQSGAPVALKCLRPEYAREARIRRRFMREARAVGQLAHPSIVQMYGYGVTDEGVPYIAMELIEGTPLSELRDRGLSLGLILAIVDQLLAALAYTHARGIVHRDVKPENLLVVGTAVEGVKPQVKLLDFGFARVEDDPEPNLTQVYGDAFGTPQYMAPEQASGKGEVGPATDCYAVGVLLYEFLAGRPPFQGAHGMAVALKHLMEPVPPLVPRLGIRLPPGLTAVVLRALEKAPHDRYVHAGDMRRALAPFLDGDDAEDDSTLVDAGALIAQVVGDAAVRATRGRLPEEHLTQEKTASEWRLTPDASSEERLFNPLAGREDTLVWLWHQVREVCERGRSKVILLGAEPGSGAAEIIRWLGDQVIEGGWMRAVGTGQSLGLKGVLGELFGQLPVERERAESQVRAVIQRWAGLAGGLDGLGVSAIVSYLRPGQPAMNAAPTEVRGDLLFTRVVDALALACRERPVLVVLDDPTRKPETVAFLEHLLERLSRLSGLPLLVIVPWVARAGGAPAEGDEELVRRLGRLVSPFVEPYLLPPLTPEGVAATLEETYKLSPASAVAVAHHTQGNPLFVRELVAFLKRTDSLVERGGQLELRARGAAWPASLSEALRLGVQEKVDGLADPPAAQVALSAAAILGDSFDYALLAEVAVRRIGDAARVEEAVEALLQARVLAEARNPHQDRLVFPEPALRAALVEALVDPQELGFLHRAAGQVMTELYAGETGPLAGQIAEHFERGQDRLRAAQFAGEAALQAWEEGQGNRAFSLLERADSLLAGLAEPEAIRQRAALWLELGELELGRAGFARAHQLAVRVQGWAHKRQDEPLEARALGLLADLARHQGALDEALKLSIQAGALYRRAREPRGVARSALAQAQVQRARGAFAEAEPLFALARDAMASIGDVLGRARAAQGLGEVALRRGELSAARGALEEAQQAFVRAGDRAGEVFCRWLLGETCRLSGDGPGARQHLAQALEGYRAVDDHGGLARCHFSLARLLLGEGQPQAAIPHLQRAIEASEAQEDHERALSLHVELAEAALEAGQHRLASVELTALLGRGRPELEVRARVGLARVAASLGDVQTCRQEMDTALRLAAAGEVVDRVFAESLELVAALECEQQAHPRAKALLARALSVHQRLGNSAEVARLRQVLSALEAP